MGWTVRAVRGILAVVAAVPVSMPVLAGGDATTGTRTVAASDPLDATYRVEGREIALRGGRHESRAAPGAATMVSTAVLGEPVRGDLDGDEGVALLLVHDPGGSGTFLYAAAARRDVGGYRGTNTVLLGDRIAPRGLAIRHGLVIADYAQRRPEDPMSAERTIAATRYLILESQALVAPPPLARGERLVAGWVTVGHEVREFRPYDGESEVWLTGDAPAVQDALAAHRRASTRAYTPLFMVLAGRFGSPPAAGSAQRYDTAFLATRLARVFLTGDYRDDHIKDNPSERRELDDAAMIPVAFD